MTVRQRIPEGLAQLAPGPELSAALAGLDIHALAGSDLVEVLRARARQLSHEQAQLLAVMAEVGVCDPAAAADEVGRLATASEYAADEIRAALAWTRTAAYREYHFAESLVVRMPRVFTALNAGTICRSKAWVFTELCTGLTDEQAGVVCDRLLAKAGGWTTGELAARIKKLAIALDPEWAARRYADAVAQRDVIGYLDEDGTATVTGRRLPADQAAAACARIEELARAAQRAGHPGRVGALRASIYLSLLDGRWAQLTREEIIADLLAQTGAADTAPDANAAEDAFAVESATGGATAPASAPGNQAPDSQVPDSQAPGDPDRRGVADQVRGEARVGVELRVGLSTLLGQDRHPGEIPGWGPVTAEVARAIAAAQHTAEWRYAITGLDGHLLLAGTTRRRPATVSTGGRGTSRGGIVELHVPAALLTELAAHFDTCGEWAGVVADLAAQYRARTMTGSADGASCQHRQHPTARFAGAVLRRHVQIRDRYCVHPGCRCPARHADVDHTVDHNKGGATTETNTGPLCGHDHTLKHDGGWRLDQHRPGHFTWTSPLGRIYHTRPQPITLTDHVDPVPRRTYPRFAPPSATIDDGPILGRPPPAPAPPDLSTRVAAPDEPPPF